MDKTKSYNEKKNKKTIGCSQWWGDGQLSMSAPRNLSTLRWSRFAGKKTRIAPVEVVQRAGGSGSSIGPGSSSRKQTRYEVLPHHQ